VAIDIETLPPLDGAVSDVGAGWWLNRLSKQLAVD
jgi:hypothetical protein